MLSYVAVKIGGSDSLQVLEEGPTHLVRPSGYIKVYKNLASIFNLLLGFIISAW